MATTETRSITINNGNATTYLTKISGNHKIPENTLGVSTAIGMTSKGTGSSKLNATAMAALYPTATARPSRADFSYVLGTNRTNSNTASVFAGGTQLFSDTMPFSTGGTTVTHNNLTSSAVTNSTRSTEWRIDSNIKEGLIYVYAAAIDNIALTLYFTRYSCGAQAVGDGINSISVSNHAPYDGDTVTFTATLKSGATFHGWFSDAACTQMVSANLSYSRAAADGTLYAKATLPVTAKTLTATYNGAGLISEQVTGDVAVTYNGGTIATLSGGTKTLLCNGKVMAGDVGIGARTLLCAGKKMAGNVVISLN